MDWLFGLHCGNRELQQLEVQWQPELWREQSHGWFVQHGRIVRYGWFLCLGRIFSFRRFLGLGRIFSFRWFLCLGRIFSFRWFLCLGRIFRLWRLLGHRRIVSCGWLLGHRRICRRGGIFRVRRHHQRGRIFRVRRDHERGRIFGHRWDDERGRIFGHRRGCYDWRDHGCAHVHARRFTYHAADYGFLDNRNGRMAPSRRRWQVGNGWHPDRQHFQLPGQHRWQHDEFHRRYDQPGSGAVRQRGGR
jgi:hypothetical protein